MLALGPDAGGMVFYQLKAAQGPQVKPRPTSSRTLLAMQWADFYDVAAVWVSPLVLRQETAS